MIRTQRLIKTLLIALLVFTAGQGSADDTEIYVGDAQASNGLILPNVLLILDTSSSMTNTDGTGVTRLDRMKDALRQIINSSNNVRMGLMRFHREGGPVLYPVSDINAAAGDVDSQGGTIDATVSSSADDAEESAVGTMTLDNAQLYLLDRAASSGAISVRVSNGNDDAEERVSNGSLNRTSSDLELMDDGNNRQLVGVRFQNIAIPTDASITSASIEFELDEYDATDTEAALTVTIYGDATNNAPAFDTQDISSRTKTSASSSWPITTGLSVNDKFSTSDIKSIVEELVSTANGWTSGNDMAFIFEHASGSGVRTTESYNGESTEAPLLTVNYSTGVGVNRQKAGFRFQTINVPQGATITNAYLGFTAAASSSNTANMVIRGEDSDDADAFAATTSNISGRTQTTASVNWSSIPAWTLGSAYQSPDITSVIQEIVSRTGWCGGNDMALILSSTSDAERIAWAYDGDTASAPTLHIEYDEDTVPDGACINQTFQAQVISGSDDAEEHATGTMDLTSSDLEMVQESDTQTVGIRFRNINIPVNTTILGASLTFTTDETGTAATSLTIKGEDVDDSAIFTTASSDISSRATTTSSASWSPGAWSTIGEAHTVTGLQSIVAEITSRPGWTAGNDMTFIITGSGKRVADSYDGDPLRSPILSVQVQGQLGTGYTTVRDRLITTVDSLNYKTGTPVQDTLYEAARYWKGNTVYYGKTRGFGHTLNDGSPGESVTSRSEYTRISHSASYGGGTVVQPSGCTDDNLNSISCINEYISEASGAATYITPIEEWCQVNHQVLLTDGYSNNAHSETLINTMVGSDYSCSGDSGCSQELVSYLHNEDQHATLQQSQNITTHTIGFNIDDPALVAIAAKGGGDYYTASSAAQLATAFTEILSGVLSQNTSFAAPSVSVNAFNKLYHDNEIYFSLFLPQRQKRWPGNLKKFNLCEGNPTDTCTLGEVIDADSLPALTGNGTFDPNSRSLWSASDDGNEVMIGGAGAKVPTNPGRTIYTYTGSTAPVNVNLGVADYTITETDKTATVGTALRTQLNGDTLSDADFESLIYWILGRDVNDEDDDSSVTDDRWSVGDSLHGSPLIVTYGQDGSSNSIKKIFMGTNDGGLHMFNADTGVEEWVFMPQALLANQVDLKNNNNGDHLYGIDGHITNWIKDVDGDGIIEPDAGDQVLIFFGMRRGGRNLYALDVTPGSTLTSTTTTGGIVPTLKWRIEGGTTTGFSYLGQTWSAPLVTTVRTGGDSTNDVLIFGGGYETSQDAAFGPSTPGNAIYAVDIDDGSIVWWAGPSGSGADMQLANMTYPIPSTVALVDSDHDGYDDRIYVGDTGGQLWRIYLGYAIGDNSQDGGRLATASSTASAADKRKFFYRPDVAKVSDTQYSSTANYDLVTIASGDRANPTDITVHDQVYAFRDYATSGGLPTGFTPLTPATNLYNATANLIQNADGSDDATEVAALKAKTGWFIDFSEPSDGSWIGEKGLSRTLILDGKAIFTTFIPGVVSVSADSCDAPAGGSGRLYAVDALNAKAVYLDWDGVGDSTNYTRADRTYDVSLPGIPSEPVPVFQKEGVTIVVGGGGGGFVFDPDVALPKVETFWYEDL